MGVRWTRGFTVRAEHDEVVKRNAVRASQWQQQLRLARR